MAAEAWGGGAEAKGRRVRGSGGEGAEWHGGRGEHSCGATHTYIDTHASLCDACGLLLLTVESECEKEKRKENPNGKQRNLSA